MNSRVIMVTDVVEQWCEVMRVDQEVIEQPIMQTQLFIAWWVQTQANIHIQQECN